MSAEYDRLSPADLSSQEEGKHAGCQEAVEGGALGSGVLPYSTGDLNPVSNVGRSAFPKSSSSLTDRPLRPMSDSRWE